MPPYKYSVSLLMSLVSLSSCFQHVHVWVFFLPFLLTSLLFFLSCFLEPWWRRSKEAEAQLRLPPRRSWYKLQWKRKKTKKRSLSCPVFTSYDTHYRIIIFILFFFVSTDVMDLQTCALKNIIWTGKAGFGSWKPTKVWNLSANCGRSLSSKKKKMKTSDWRQQKPDVEKRAMRGPHGSEQVYKNATLNKNAWTERCKDLKKRNRTLLMFGQSHLTWSYSVLAWTTSGRVCFRIRTFIWTLSHVVKNHLGSFIYLFIILFFARTACHEVALLY